MKKTNKIENLLLDIYGNENGWVQYCGDGVEVLSVNKVAKEYFIDKLLDELEGEVTIESDSNTIKKICEHYRKNIIVELHEELYNMQPYHNNFDEESIPF